MEVSVLNKAACISQDKSEKKDLRKQSHEVNIQLAKMYQKFAADKTNDEQKAGYLQKMADALSVAVYTYEDEDKNENTYLLKQSREIRKKLANKTNDEQKSALHELNQSKSNNSSSIISKAITWIKFTLFLPLTPLKSVYNFLFNKK